MCRYLGDLSTGMLNTDRTQRGGYRDPARRFDAAPLMHADCRQNFVGNPAVELCEPL
jgi:hypothetical protein